MATTKHTLPHNATVYLRHDSGAMHAYGGRRFVKLFRALERGEGGDICCNLICNGYSELMSGRCIDSISAEDLIAELAGR